MLLVRLDLAPRSLSYNSIVLICSDISFLIVNLFILFKELQDVVIFFVIQLFQTTRLQFKSYTRIVHRGNSVCK